jgi:hypothetical protein
VAIDSGKTKCLKGDVPLRDFKDFGWQDLAIRDLDHRAALEWKD